MKGKLYVVATPIGNLKDITLRALETLESVALVAAEDTRVSMKLLSHFGIRKPVVSNFAGNEAKRVSEILKVVEEGKDVALITDAGTPSLSDPGAMLARALKKEGVEVIPVPGPSSLTAAISVCGFDDHPLTFYGFFPRKGGEKARVFEEIKRLSHTVAMFESPLRIRRTLEEIYSAFPERKVFVAREMTKKFESYMTDPEVDAVPEKGEFVIMLSPPSETGAAEDFNEDEARAEFEKLKAAGASGKDAVKTLSKRLKISRRMLYNMLLVKGEESGP